MTTLQDNKLSMYLAVQEVCQQSTAEWNTVPAARTFAEFEQSILQIQTGLRRQKLRMTGAAVSKMKARQALVDKAYPVAQAIVVYAHETGDMLLAQQVDHTLSYWMKSRPNLLRELVAQLLQIAAPLVPALAEYQVTTDDLTQLGALLDAYTTVAHTPRVAVSHRREATQSMQAGFAKSDALLGLLDRLFVQYRNKPFYKVYRSARKIVRVRGGARTLPVNKPTVATAESHQ